MLYFLCIIEILAKAELWSHKCDFICLGFFLYVCFILLHTAVGRYTIQNAPHKYSSPRWFYLLSIGSQAGTSLEASFVCKQFSVFFFFSFAMQGRYMALIIFQMFILFICHFLSPRSTLEKSKHALCGAGQHSAVINLAALWDLFRLMQGTKSK